MPKVTFKNIVIFLKMFGISSLFFISGIVICFIGEQKLGMKWPAHVIISALLIIASVIIILIIETIKYIKTNKKEQEADSIEDVIKKKIQNIKRCYK